MEDGEKAYLREMQGEIERRKGMTEKKAIARIRDHIAVHELHEERAVHITKALNMAINALEEIQQYREFEAIFRHEMSDVAVEFLSDKQEFGKWLKRGKCISKKADEALRENEKYREIGTVEECRTAVEKQKSKTPSYEGDGCDFDGNIILDTWICPKCEEYYEMDYDNYKYCPNCGQAIDWSEEE